jgi:phosphate transport system substrate-binding protein
MKFRIKPLVLLFIIVAFYSSGFAEGLRYSGSSTVGLFIRDAAKVYPGGFASINVKFESKGGEISTIRGHSDIGGVARAVSQKFIKKGLRKFLIGKDAIGIWVNKKNPVKKLSLKQLKDIYSGKITNWKIVGGKSGIIHVGIVGIESATRKVFQNIVLSGGRYGGKKIQTIRPDRKIIDFVANNPNAIGQLSFSIGNNHKLYGKVKKLYINNQNPSVNNPDYMIVRPLYLVVMGVPKAEVKKFIDWSLSNSGQKVVKRNFIGVK